MYSGTNTHPRDREYWEAHVTAWKESGLSQAHYCRQNDLPLNRFYNWKAKLEPQKLVPVKIAEESDQQFISNRVEKMTIQLPNGIELHIPSNLSIESVLPGLTALQLAS